MSGGEPRGEVSGWGSCMAAVLVIGVVLAALISLAALVDPFSWMPPVGEVWAECTGEELGTERDECALENRFPGFWWHAGVNVLYAAVALGLLVAFAGAVADLRAKRLLRFSSAEAAREHHEAQGLCIGCGMALAAMAVLPLVVAVA